jgi:hypothetical protein
MTTMTTVTSHASRVRFTLSCLQDGLFKTRARRRAEEERLRILAKEKHDAQIAANLAANWRD